MIAPSLVTVSEPISSLNELLHKPAFFAIRVMSALSVAMVLKTPAPW
jgi:hypothetical protein